VTHVLALEQLTPASEVLVVENGGARVCLTHSVPFQRSASTTVSVLVVYWPTTTQSVMLAHDTEANLLVIAPVIVAPV
jgi:hypothetical protein